jgi:hypothetical protein
MIATFGWAGGDLRAVQIDGCLTATSTLYAQSEAILGISRAFMGNWTSSPVFITSNVVGSAPSRWFCSIAFFRQGNFQ